MLFRVFRILDVPLKVYGVILLRAFRVEEDDEAVVQVEDNGGARVLRDGLCQTAVTAAAFHHEHGLFATFVKKFFKAGVGGDQDQLHHVKWQFVVDDDCLVAAGFQVFRYANPVYGLPGLQEVGQSEVQLAQFAPQLALVPVQLFIGIVGPVLVDDIANEAVVRGRLDAESPAVGQSAQPYPCFLNDVHAFFLAVKAEALLLVSSFEGLLYAGHGGRHGGCGGA